VRLRAEKKARSERATAVAPEHVSAFRAAAAPPAAPERAQESDGSGLHWEAGALARLARVPEGFMRDATRQRIESHARQQGASTVSLDLAENGIAAARTAMEEKAAAGDGRPSKCPFSKLAGPRPAPEPVASAPAWTMEAIARLQSVPEGFCRTMTERALNTLARQGDRQRIDVEFVQAVLGVFENGSRSAATGMPWAESARERIERAPEIVRGMLIKEIEGWARRNGLEEVDEGAVEAVKREWQAGGVFHLDPEDRRHEL
jgi:proto-chlorophyllide reductase subunit